MLSAAGMCGSDLLPTRGGDLLLDQLHEHRRFTDGRADDSGRRAGSPDGY